MFNSRSNVVLPVLRSIAIGACLVAAIAVSAPSARAENDVYDITFTSSSGPDAVPVGSFDYDPTLGFTNFDVTFAGETYDFTSVANAPTVTGSGAGCGTTSTPQTAFALLDGNCNVTGDLSAARTNLTFDAKGLLGSTQFAVTQTNTNVAVGGDTYGFSITDEGPVAAPEPGTASLLLIGAMALLGARRIRRGAHATKTDQPVQ